MDMGILARNGPKKNQDPMTNNTSHKKREANSCLEEKTMLPLVESGGTPIGGAQTRTQKTKTESPEGCNSGQRKGGPI